MYPLPQQHQSRPPTSVRSVNSKQPLSPTTTTYCHSSPRNFQQQTSPTGSQNVSPTFYFGSPQNDSSPTTRTPISNASANTSGGAQYTLIANVPYDTVRQDLVVEFRKYGRVELAMVVCDEASRHPHKEWTSTAGYAFVRFSQREEAAAAIQAASLGLITIRGTRVRADWARKDSYAKRGRVSPTQGAPILGPLGVPDGIHQLRQLSMLDQSSPHHFQTPSHRLGLGRRSMSHLSGPEHTNDRPLAPQLLSTNTDSLKFLYSANSNNNGPARGSPGNQRFPQTGSSNREILQALQDAFGYILSSKMPPDDSRGFSTAPTTPQVYSHDEIKQSRTLPLPRQSSLNFMSESPKNSSGQGQASQNPVVSFCKSLPACYDGLSADEPSGASTGANLARTAPTRPLLPKECWMLEASPSSADMGGAIHHRSPMSRTSISPSEPQHSFDDVLSPVSRGLLAQALSDVAEAFDVASPARGSVHASPEELLQRAVQAQATSILSASTVASDSGNMEKSVGQQQYLAARPSEFAAVHQPLPSSSSSSTSTSSSRSIAASGDDKEEIDNDKRCDIATQSFGEEEEEKATAQV